MFEIGDIVWWEDGSGILRGWHTMGGIEYAKVDEGFRQCSYVPKDCLYLPK